MAFIFSGGGRDILPDGSTSPSIFTHGFATGNGAPNFDSLLGSLFNSYSSMQSSAMQAQIDMIREQNAFNAGQAALNRAFQQQSAERAMQFEKEQSKVAMDFSERMRDTQYQSAVRDLQKAGLNPILAYQNLNSSAPTGVSASGVAASGSQASSSGSNISSALKIDKSDLLSAIVSLFLARENNSAAMDRVMENNSASMARTLVSGLFDVIGSSIKSSNSYS